MFTEKTQLSLFRVRRLMKNRVLVRHDECKRVLDRRFWRGCLSVTQFTGRVTRNQEEFVSGSGGDISRRLS